MFPILIPRRVLNAKHHKWQGLLDIKFFRPFPLKYLGSHLGMVNLIVMVCGKQYYNNQDNNEQELHTFNQLSLMVIISRGD